MKAKGIPYLLRKLGISQHQIFTKLIYTAKDIELQARLNVQVDRAQKPGEN